MEFRSFTTAARNALLATAALSALLAAAPASASYLVKHPFAGPGGDGASTFTNIIKVGSVFYGTTTYGGTGPCPSGCGTFFTMTPGGLENVLYNFQGGNDGAYPRGSLVLTKTPTGPAIYGTTMQGGAGPATNCPDFGSCGTVFDWQLNSSTLNTAYAFQGGADGYAPLSGMALGANGALYGVTMDGGKSTSICHTSYSQCGTIFSIASASTNAETVLYRFRGMANSDGANPVGTPLAQGAKLYGTTGYGGQACTNLPNGCGTVWGFKISTLNESVLYKFQGMANNDGADPYGQLAMAGGTLWGTTFYGGASNNGMVFNLTPVTSTSWAETNIWNFTGGSDGGHPGGGLTQMGSTLYGATSSGGNAGCQYLYSSPGCGTIFKVTGTTLTPAIYSFNGVSDGGNPYDTLIKDGAYLWGTTFGGGTLPSGASAYGTVFRFN